MLQLVNHTPFDASFFIFPNRQGVDTLYLVIKAAFDLLPEVQIAAEQEPVRLADEYWGEPGRSSIKFASEAHLEKPGTDVVMVGSACSESGRAVESLEVGLSVADRTGGFRVVGDRSWKGGALTARPGKPKPFFRMPLIYERAFGGMHCVTTDQGEQVFAEPKNPVGVGFKGKRSFEQMKSELLPNLEDRKQSMSSPRARPPVVGFGFVAPWWEPRVSYAGTYDESWRKNRAPYLPLDFDPRFFHSAHPDWIFANPLRGGEPVSILHLSPRGKQSFKVPLCSFSTTATISGDRQPSNFRMETLLLMPSDERMCLTYRAAWLCDKKTLEIERIEVKLDGCVTR